MRYFIKVLKNLKKIIVCLLILSFLSAYDYKIEIITASSMMPREEHMDMCFYYSILSEFREDSLDDIKWEKLSEYAAFPNDNIFLMLMLLDTENQKIRLLEMFMNYDCESYTTTFDDFLSDPVNKKYFPLAKNKLIQILSSVGFSYEYTEAFFQKYFTFDRINLKFLYIILSFNKHKFDARISNVLFSVVPQNSELINWMSQKILEIERC